MEKSEKNLKGISKALYIIARIGKILAIIMAVFMVIAAIVFPIITANIRVSGNEIKVYDEVITYRQDGSKLTVNYGDDEQVIDLESEKIADTLVSMITNDNIVKGTIYLEILFVTLIALLIIGSIILARLDRLFLNIHDEDTPFKEENAKLLRSMGTLTLACIIIAFVVDTVCEMIFGYSFGFDVSIAAIVDVLFLYALAYIFDYGTKLQKKSKMRIYSVVNDEQE